jgi:citrate synthase
MAAGALYGPKHGGANEAVIRMLEAIGSKDNVQRFILEVKQKKKVLFGFGHRVYKIVKKIAFEIFDILGR